MKNTDIYLKDIITAIERIEKFTKEMSEEDFMNDDKTASAVIRKYEIIGEAAKNVSPEIKEKNPGIPWKEMAGMRDRLIHAYSGVDYGLIWNNIKNNLAKVKEKINKII